MTHSVLDLYFKVFSIENRLMGALKINDKTPKVEQKIFELLSCGTLIKQIAAELPCDINVINKWRQRDPLFDQEFIRARMFGLDLLADELLSIPDEYDDVNKARLKCDSIKWYLSKLNSNKYGDRLDLNVTNVIDISSALLEARNRISQVIDITPKLHIEATDYKSVAQTGSTVKNDPLAEFL